MRRTWPIALLLLAVGAGAFAQGLGELAEQEKARRRKQRDADTAKVFTNDDLPQHAPSPSPSPSPPPAARPPAGTTRTGRVRPRTAPITPVTQEQPGKSEVEEASPAQEAAPPAPDQAGAESYWRGRAQELRDAVAAAEKKVAEAQTKVDRTRKGLIQPLPIDAMRQIPPNPMLKSQELVGVEDELAAAQAELARASSALADFEDEARRKGALPGWLR